MLNDTDFLQIVDATPLVSIDLIVRNERAEVLLGRRANRPAQGMWFVPGGRIRKNERVKDALQRISARELGVTIAEAKLLGVFDHIYPDNFLGAPGVNTHYVVLGMAAELRGDLTFTADEQHEELKWWPVEQLLAEAAVHENTKAYFRS
ncbi:MAG TPA: GDP-mannose mannosyl hydrolase [Verrucomicrobiae bacterium]|jgi:colanic acid biosynthesis protein WcaH